MLFCRLMGLDASAGPRWQYWSKRTSVSHMDVTTPNSKTTAYASACFMPVALQTLAIVLWQPGSNMVGSSGAVTPGGTLTVRRQ